MTVRRATDDDAAVVARLLDAFNREYDTPSPGVVVLTTRLERLLAGGDVVALLADDPAAGVALITLRATEQLVRHRGGEVLEINVDADDVDARRFYERHGYRNSDVGSDEPLLYYFRELD